MIARDDPILREHPDAVPFWERAKVMQVWFALNRNDSDRFVNLPEWRLVAETDVLWPGMEMELI